MTRIDFYLLDDTSLNAGARFACRLAQKAADGGHQVYVHTNNSDHAQQMDTLMWDYPEHRFLPHSLLVQSGSSAAEVSAPLSSVEASTVLIGHGDTARSVGDQVLINLADQIPEFFGRFERVAEIIVGERRDEGREHYKFYRDCGYPLYHHEMNNWEEA